MNRLSALLGLALVFPPTDQLWGQSRFFHFGLTSSFGWQHGDCSFSFSSCPGDQRYRTEAFPFFTGGVSWAVTPRPWLTTELGALFTLKGRSGSGGAEQVTPFLEIPLMLGLGYWPRQPGDLGVGLIGGIAPDLALSHPDNSDLAILRGVELRGISSGGAVWSLAVRYARGRRSFEDVQFGTLTAVFGYSPSRKK